MAVAREMANTNIHELSRFVVTIYLALCEQYVKCLGPTAWGFHSLFARALLQCDNRPLQNTITLILKLTITNDNTVLLLKHEAGAW